METTENLKSLITKIEGKKIWDFRIGESSGSIISFECGEKIKCEGEDEIRTHEGEYSFMVYSSWRICNTNKIITSWKDDTAMLKKGASEIEDLKILNVSVSEGFDLVLKLENEFSLHVFCDEGVNSDFNCNWFFRDDQKYYSINNNGEIEIE